MVPNWLPSFSSRVPITVTALCVPLSTSRRWEIFFFFFLVLLEISLYYCNSLEFERNKQFPFGWGGWKFPVCSGNWRCAKQCPPPPRKCCLCLFSALGAGSEDGALGGSVTSACALTWCPPPHPAERVGSWPGVDMQRKGVGLPWCCLGGRAWWR